MYTKTPFKKFIENCIIIPLFFVLEIVITIKLEFVNRVKKSPVLK